MSPRRALLGLIALALVAASAVVVLAAGPDPLLARAFEVRYRALGDAADLVEGLISAEGSVTLKPHLRVMVVQDRASVLERVESLLKSFDLPPRNVEVTLSLFLGSRQQPDESAATTPRRPPIDLPQLQFTNFNAYESLGSRSVNGVEGYPVTTDLSDSYRVSFLVEAVDDRHNMVKFKSVTLQRVLRGVEGPPRVEDLYTMAMVVEAGKPHVFGAAAGPDAQRALFLTLQARVR